MTCILCNNKKFKTLFPKIYKCTNCGLVRTKVTKKQSTTYHRDEDYKAYKKYYQNFFRKRFNIINKFAKGKGKVLDIGASTGTFLDLYKQKGWQTWGIEPSNIKNKNHKYISLTLEKAKLPKNYFDLILLNHTLEHFNNPLKALAKIHTSLRNGGVVFIDVPNFDSLSSQFSKSNWKYLLPEEHFHHFTPQTLSKLLIKSGFKIIYTKSHSGIFDVQNSLLKFFHQLTSLKPHFYKNMTIDILRIPIDILETSLGIGQSLKILAKK